MEAKATCRFSTDRDARIRVPQEEQHIQPEFKGEPHSGQEKYACGDAFARFAIPFPISFRTSYCQSQPSLGHVPWGGLSSVQINCLPHSGQLILSMHPFRDVAK